MMMCQYCTISSDSITSTPLFLRRYRSSLKSGPARGITHQRQQHIVTFRHLDTIILPFVYSKQYLWSRLAPPTNLVNWSKRSERLFERSQSCMPETTKMVMGDIKSAVCMCVSVCLFGMHLLQNCWMDLAEILHRDRVCSDTASRDVRKTEIQCGFSFKKPNRPKFDICSDGFPI